MAVDVEALKALGLSDEDIAQIAAIDAGNFPSMTAAPQPVTNRIAGAYDYTPLYGAGDIIPGTTAGIFQNLGIENPNVPVFRLLGSENKGGTNVNESMNFAAIPGQSYRLVNKATGDVLGEASTPEGISALVEQSNALSKQLGKKADLSFETSTPEVFGGGYSPIFQDQPNELVGGVFGNVLDVALPALGFALAGPLGAGAASGLSSAAQERSLKEALIRAAITAGTAALVPGGPVPGSDAAVNATANAALQNAINAGAQAGTQALGSVYGSALGSALSSAAGSTATSALAPAVGDIVVTAARNAAPSTLFPAATSGISNTLLDRVINQPAQPQDAQQAAQQEYTPPPEEIVLTAPQNILPPAFTAPEALATSAAANALGSTVAQSPDVTQGMTQQEIEDVTMAGAGGGGLLGKLTANMGLTDYLTAASLLGSAIGSIGGSGGRGITAMPYVSPFGAGVGFGTGRDMRVNPNITDYERYGFGPEATFFAPGYSQLVSGAAGAPAATTMGPQGAMVNPQYVPLI
jgi:hypothetical protein